MFSGTGDDPEGMVPLRQFRRNMAADKAGGSGDEKGALFLFSFFFQNISGYSNRSTP
jgi:hypothetical protein